jgi:hypothetical protein
MGTLSTSSFPHFTDISWFHPRRVSERLNANLWRDSVSAVCLRSPPFELDRLYATLKFVKSNSATQLSYEPMNHTMAVSAKSRRAHAISPRKSMLLWIANKYGLLDVRLPKTTLTQGSKSIVPHLSAINYGNGDLGSGSV